MFGLFRIPIEFSTWNHLDVQCKSLKTQKHVPGQLKKMLVKPWVNIRYQESSKYLSLLWVNVMEGKPSLAVIQQSEVLICLGDGNDICIGVDRALYASHHTCKSPYDTSYCPQGHINSLTTSTRKKLERNYWWDIHKVKPQLQLVGQKNPPMKPAG
jgi:hypothetical protein